MFRALRLISIAFMLQQKPSVCFVVLQAFGIFLWFHYHLQYVDDVCKPNIHKVNILYITGKTSAKSYIKVIENTWLSASCKMRCKTFQTWIKIFTCICVPMSIPLPDLIFCFYFLLNDFLKIWYKNAFISLTLPDPCMTISEWPYSWGSVKLFWHLSLLTVC